MTPLLPFPAEKGIPLTKSLGRARDELFVGVTAFDAHCTGSFSEAIYKMGRDGKLTKHVIGYLPHTRRCLTVPEMLAQGMFKKEKGL